MSQDFVIGFFTGCQISFSKWISAVYWFKPLICHCYTRLQSKKKSKEHSEKREGSKENTVKVGGLGKQLAATIHTQAKHLPILLASNKQNFIKK